jgi:hypothetical protein
MIVVMPMMAKMVLLRMNLKMDAKSKNLDISSCWYYHDVAYPTSCKAVKVVD